ncbi:Hypothetical predicted protein [Paramuricea clavata]|uniref:Uncharacterized protein n=1 Tax=Paramuricea clavata TaxID=317549 RepID=A0A6S7GXK9_PARCT|nr:Hypothetical predicted protein [Paramuricea clavata]
MLNGEIEKLSVKNKVSFGFDDDDDENSCSSITVETGICTACNDEEYIHQRGKSGKQKRHDHDDEGCYHNLLDKLEKVCACTLRTDNEFACLCCDEPYDFSYMFEQPDQQQQPEQQLEQEQDDGYTEMMKQHDEMYAEMMRSLNDIIDEDE